VKRILTSALLILIAAASRADTLGEMRSALLQLGGKSAIKATYEVRRSRQSEGRFVNDNFTGTVTVELESDNAAFRIVFPQTLLATINDEQRVRLLDSKKDTPTLNALWDVSPVTASGAVNFAPLLLRMIDGGKIAGDRPVMVQGRPGHLLVLDLPPPKQPSGTFDLGRVTYENDRMTIWLGDDGVPVSAEHVRTTKASALIFKAESKETEKWIFGRENDHLLRLRYETSVNASGLGQKGISSTVFTLTPHR